MISNPFSKNVAEALASEHFNAVFAAEFEFKTGTSRVHTGVGEILIGGQIFYGLGDLGQVGTVSEVNDTSAQSVSVQLSGLNPQLIAISLNESSIGRPVNLYIAVTDDDYTSVRSNLLFRGKLTSASVITGEQNAISYSISSVFEEWSKGKPYRYTDESHQKRNGGDRIFRYVAQMSEKSIYWGSAKDAPTFRYE